MNDRLPSRRPTALTVHQRTRVLEVGFDDGQTFRIPFELMRVSSPGAKVKGHGPGQEVLQTGKRLVERSSATEAISNCAVRPQILSDGHDTGIFSWDYLYLLRLAKRPELWQTVRGPGLPGASSAAATKAHAFRNTHVRLRPRHLEKLHQHR